MKFTYEQVEQEIKAEDAEQQWWHDIELAENLRTINRNITSETKSSGG